MEFRKEYSKLKVKIKDNSKYLNMLDVNEIKNEEMEGLSVQAIRKRKVYKKAPDAPKRFKSAYICFVMHKMEEVKQLLPQDAKVKLIINPI